METMNHREQALEYSDQDKVKCGDFTRLWDSPVCCNFFLLMEKYCNLYFVPQLLHIFYLISFLHPKVPEWLFSRASGTRNGWKDERNRHDLKVTPLSDFDLGSASTNFLSLSSTMNFNMIFIATRGLLLIFILWKVLITFIRSQKCPSCRNLGFCRVTYFVFA